MTLLYAALAYMVGLALARWWFDAGGAGCPLPPALWLLPLTLLPLTPLLDKLRSPAAHPPLRWPEAAGFKPPGPPPPTLPSPARVVGVMLCLAAGCLRYGGAPFTTCPAASDLAFYNLPSAAAFDRSAEAVEVRGMIDAYPLLVDGEQELYVAAVSLQRASGYSGHEGAGEEPSRTQAVTGRVRVTTTQAARLHYGQVVAVTGRLVEPGIFEGFSYRDFLAIRGVRSVMYGARVQAAGGAEQGNPLLRALYTLRAQGEALIARSLPEPYAALAAGMLLGLRANIPQDLYDQFNATGTSHVIVISGTNVAMVAGVIIAVAARVAGKRRAVWPALCAIACYALLVGGEASVLRAALMGGLFVAATALRRRSTALVSLAAACMALTLANPLELWDVGLHLSSTATAGLILLAPPLGAALRRGLGTTPHWVRAVGEDVLAVTLAASVATLPIILYTFGRVSLVSVAANLLIAPVQPLILFGGSAAVALGVSGATWLGGVLLWLPWLGLAWTVAVVRAAAGLPLAAVQMEGFGMVQLTAAYGLIGLAKWHKPLWAALVSHTPGATSSTAARGAAAPARGGVAALLVAPAALAAAAVVAALVWAGALAQPDGRLHVWFLDVGQGDGILIQTPSGRQVLVDGGASSQALLGQMGAVMPFWDRSLDLLVLTHPDADHMDAQVEVLGRYGVQTVWATAAGLASESSESWRKAADTAGARVQVQAGGGWADLGDGVALWVLSPRGEGLAGEDADNENSLVAKLVYGEFSVLLTGDAGEEVEAQLAAGHAPLAATVLKVAHHGSKFSTGAAFVQAVNPLLAVIEVGADNDYGHPSPEVLQRLAGRTVLRTDQEGRVEITSDGRQMWVEQE